MSSVWLPATLADVEDGDFVRRPGSMIFRVDDYKPLDETRISLTLFRPEGVQRHVLNRTVKLEVRIEKDGVLTAAGRRFDGLSADGARALREQLEAEVIAVQDKTGQFFNPWIVQSVYDSSTLASHLFLFHDCFVPTPVDRALVAELRKTHADFHVAHHRERPETARRIPHIHNQEVFERQRK